MKQKKAFHKKIHIFIVFILLTLIQILINTGCSKRDTLFLESENENVIPQYEDKDHVVFDTGRGTGPYDMMTYPKYYSEISFIPHVNMTVSKVQPDIWYGNGTCGYSVTISNRYSRPVASQSGSWDDDGEDNVLLPDQHFDSAVPLYANEPYTITFEIWTTKSVGIYTTGNRSEGITGDGQFSVNYARSDTWNHFERGSVAFQLIYSQKE